MEISDSLKKQAMDEVNGRASTAQIRAYPGSGSPVSPATPFTYTDPATPLIHPIPESVKRQAMDAMKDPVVRAQIRLLQDTGYTSPSWMLTCGHGPHAEKIARLYDLGLGTDSIHREITQDGFGR